MSERAWEIKFWTKCEIVDSPNEDEDEDDDMENDGDERRFFTYKSRLSAFLHAEPILPALI